MSIEWFEVAILDGILFSLVQPQTKKHWHLNRKSASHKGGMEAQLEEIFGPILVLPQAWLRLLYGLSGRTLPHPKPVPIKTRAPKNGESLGRCNRTYMTSKRRHCLRCVLSGLDALPTQMDVYPLFLEIQMWRSFFKTVLGSANVCIHPDKNKKDRDLQVVTYLILHCRWTHSSTDFTYK